jgi:hypothetical protein
MALCGWSSFASAGLVLDMDGEASEPKSHCHSAAAREPSVAESFGLEQTGAGFHAADATGDSPTSTLAQAEPHKCSVCAACCTAAAVSNESPLIAEPSAGPVVFLSVVQSVAPFAAGGPDRPPRPLVV